MQANRIKRLAFARFVSQAVKRNRAAGGVKRIAQDDSFVQERGAVFPVQAGLVRR
jgi:hypothetical protein